MKNKITQIVGFLLIGIILPSMAFASTNDDLQAQINALIDQLQRQGGSMSSYTHVAQIAQNDSCNFGAQLFLGVYSPEVVNLQRILNQSDTPRARRFPILRSSTSAK